MRSADAYGDLLRMGRPVVTTGEAAARWGAEQRTAGRRLRVLGEAGLIRRMRRGLWALDPALAPFALAPYLTAPFPAYVSLWSALSHHGMIEQVPGRISVASLDRARRIATSVGVYEVHRIAPELFGGYRGSEEEGFLATPEKALFDIAYLRAASGSQAYFPELTLPPDFSREGIEEWIDRIAAPRLQTLVSRRLREVLEASE